MVVTVAPIAMVDPTIRPTKVDRASPDFASNRQAMLDEARSESDRIIRSAQDEAEKLPEFVLRG